uniref:Uncharacterized protein n=1 Tax=Aegilops tauschii subsp. strangulata TaxID=200361 RepID=A0A453A3U3_AEGTS
CSHVDSVKRKKIWAFVRPWWRSCAGRKISRDHCSFSSTSVRVRGEVARGPRFQQLVSEPQGSRSGRGARWRPRRTRPTWRHRLRRVATATRGESAAVRCDVVRAKSTVVAETRRPQRTCVVVQRSRRLGATTVEARGTEPRRPRRTCVVAQRLRWRGVAAWRCKRSGAGQ